MALLGNLKGSAQVFQDTEFYNGAISQSLRLSVGSNYKLDRQMVTPTSVTGTICTASWWLKKSAHGTVQSFIHCRDNQSSGNYAAYWTYDTSFGSNDHHSFRNEVDSLHVGTDTSVVPYRDASGWYHVVIRYDSTQSTAADRIRIYKNGTLQNSNFATTTYPSQNHVDTFWNNAGEHLILFGNGEDSGDSFDGYIAEFNWVDGQSLAPETFGELKNGVWIPKKITLSTSDYGLNGSRYTFADSSDIGKDTSGVGNDLDRVSNLSAHDVVPDSPENNFCTMNSLVQTNDAAGDLSEGNLKITKSGTTYSFFQSTFGVRTGKWYAEIRCNAKTDVHFMIGVTEMNMETYRTGDGIDPHTTAGTVWYSDNGYGHYEGSGVSTSTFSNDTGFNAGQVVGIALDLDSGTRTVKFYVDGSLVTTQNLPSSMVDHIGFACNWYNAHTGVWNFGQDSTFAGEETAGGNSDGNGIGDFHTSVPSGYLALCTSNFDDDNFATIGPDSATQADDHFNTVLWTGNASSRSITGVGFQPDWVWFKPRSDADNHVLIDSSRGGTKYLMSNRTDAEITEAQGISSFDSDGFSIGNWTNINENSQTYVAWNWKANGGTTTTNDASATGVGNIDSVIQANTTAGFSIVTYTGNGTDNTDLGIAHGLGVTPKMVWVKNRSTAKSWQVYNSNFSADGTYGIKNALLDSSGGEDAYSDYIKTTSSTTFTIRSDASDGVGRVNKNGDNYVAYCFAEVEGYSKIGIYTANENTDGAFIYLGFRPAWAMIKRTAGNGWAIQDSARSTFNPVNNLLQANESNTEYTTDVKMDFVSNGIKMRNDSGFFNHVAGNSFIYMAFAEAPFKYANGR